MNKGSNTFKIDENSKNAKSIIDGILKIIYCLFFFPLHAFHLQVTNWGSEVKDYGQDNRPEFLSVFSYVMLVIWG